MNIFVGNISQGATVGDLRHVFERFGRVTSATILRDKTTGRSRGFGFVNIPNEAEAQIALSNLNGVELKGQAIVVNKARPRYEGRSGDESSRFRQ